MKHEERIKYSYECMLDPKRMVAFYMKLTILNCLVHMMDDELQELDPDVALLLDKKAYKLMGEATRKCDNLVNMLFNTSNRKMDADVYGAVVNRATYTKNAFRDLLLFADQEWQIREVMNCTSRVISEDFKERKMLEFYETMVERSNELKTILKKNMMNLEEIKQKRKEAEFAYLKGREALLDLQDCHNEAIANLNVEIKKKELEIQMKRAEITITYSKINNLKSVYQQTLIALAEEEKKALEQLKTIEND